MLIFFSWEVGEDTYESTLITFSKESDPVATAQSFTINGNTVKSVLIEGLTGLTKYAYTLTPLNCKTEELAKIDEKHFKMSYTTEACEFITMLLKPSSTCYALNTV